MSGSEHKAKTAQKEVPDVIINPVTRKRYIKGKFLGKGGFARCFELVDAETKEIFAGKIVSKSLLTKKHQKDKMTQEICIHRALSHKHIVKFISHFEDEDNVYILLELCRRRSLMELHKRRRAITEPEARYYTFQIVMACKYLHDTRVIHRDLKLGNLFLNDEMEIKIGDFGLATQLDYDGERKKLCGTPNYIAPEMLGKKGHSYEVDTWAIGCILFTLLVGKPPFETQTLKETYMRIKRNEYHVPSRVSAPAKHLIQKLLQAEPHNRPTINDILTFDFFTQGYIPSSLPVSCLTMQPNFPKDSPLQSAARRPLGDNTNKECASPLLQARKDQMLLPVRSMKSVPENAVMPMTLELNSKQQIESVASDRPENSAEYHLHRLFRQLTQLLHSKPGEKREPLEDEAEDPAAMPIYWISKWVDYSDKYGLGYQLCDNSVGVLFNDFSKILLNGNGERFQYIDRDNNEEFYQLESSPEPLAKKVTLLKYFRNYMNEHLLKAGEHVAPKECDELARLPCLRQWFRTRSAIILFLNNGILQINFFKDHAKLILCPMMGAVTFINEEREFKTYRFTLLEQFGCSPELAERLAYARNMVERLLMKTSSSARPGNVPSAGSQTANVNVAVPMVVGK